MCYSKLRNVSGGEKGAQSFGMAWVSRGKLHPELVPSLSIDGGSSMCGGTVTGGSLEHSRNAEETSVS